MIALNNNFMVHFIGISCTDFPHVIINNRIYVVGENGNKWVAVLVCPCGCNEVIQLNMVEGPQACWQAKIHRNKSITLRPSVWRITGCKSHFTIRRGKVNWVKDIFFEF